MNGKIWVGLALIASSYGQLLAPRSIFDRPSYFFFGYALLPGNLLAFSAVVFTLGVIVVGEGVCQRFGGASLWRFAVASPTRLLRVVLCASAAGLTLELIGQWLGKLWVYPYWTTWLYWLVVVPGFAFYWACIVESYLAVKSLLDLYWRPVVAQRARPVNRHYAGALGVVCLAIGAWLLARWYASDGGYVFAVVRPVPSAPPLGYAFLVFVGVWLTAEWVLARRGAPSLLASLRQRYWVPPVAMLGASALLSLVMETQNLAHQYWRYADIAGLHATFAGVQVWVLVAWPLHYVLFLILPSLLVPGLGRLFWQRDTGAGARR